MTRSFLAALMMALAACSLANREGPDLSCAELQQGAINACGDGIITACVAGTVVYQVCDDKDACSASWQSPGRYGCTSAEAAAFKPTAGAGGVGGGAGSSSTAGTTSTAGTSSTGGHSGAIGTAGYHTCGTDFPSEDCGKCLGDSKCCQPLTGCALDPECTSCLHRTGDQTPCDPAVVDTYNKVLECLAKTCTAECQ